MVEHIKRVMHSYFLLCFFFSFLNYTFFCLYEGRKKTKTKLLDFSSVSCLFRLVGSIPGFPSPFLSFFLLSLKRSIWQNVKWENYIRYKFNFEDILVRGLIFWGKIFSDAFFIIPSRLFATVAVRVWWFPRRIHDEVGNRMG